MEAYALQIIRTDARISDANFSHGAEVTTAEGERAILQRNLLLEYVDELTRQRDDARRIAIDTGAFQGLTNEDYDHDYGTFTAEPVGAVDWDKR